MSLFSKKPKVVHEWQYMPYGFEAGQKYVIEIDRTKLTDINELRELQHYFESNGIVCRLVLTNGNAIQPVRVATHREVEA